MSTSCRAGKGPRGRDAVSFCVEDQGEAALAVAHPERRGWGAVGIREGKRES